MIAELPISFAVPMMLVLIIYFAIGFQDEASTFFKFYLMLLLMVQAATALGYFLSSSFNHETTAVALSPLINLPLSLLGGYMINLNIASKTPPTYVVAWLSYFSPVRYGFSGLLHTEFDCTLIEANPTTLAIDPSLCTPVITDSCCDASNNLVLNQYGFEGGYFYDSVIGLIMLWILFRVLTVVSLKLQDRSCQKVQAGDTRNKEIFGDDAGSRGVSGSIAGLGSLAEFS